MVSSGLDYLHSKSIIHLDIEGANLHISMEGCVKIGELGSARSLENNIYIYVSRFFLLTPGMEHTTKYLGHALCWMAPEVLEQNGHDICANVWSLGMVILEMLSGASHSWVKVEKRMIDTVDAIMASQMPQLSNNIQVSPELNVLLKRIFVPAKDRPYSWVLLKDP